MRKLGSIPTVIILSQVCCESFFLFLFTVLTKLYWNIQDGFYKYLNEEELALAHANMHDFDHPDAVDMSLFASVRVLYYKFTITAQLIHRLFNSV